MEVGVLLVLDEELVLGRPLEDLLLPPPEDGVYVGVKDPTWLLVLSSAVVVLGELRGLGVQPVVLALGELVGLVGIRALLLLTVAVAGF